MYVNPLQISLETLIGAAPLLGHALEDRASIRNAQDWKLLKRLQAETSTPLRGPSQERLFCVAPLDVLVTEEAGVKRFHIIEINGTGIGGLTNLTTDAISCVLDNLCQFAQTIVEPDPLVLIASSCKENEQTPRLNKIIHEKILYAEALKRGFEYAGENPNVCTLASLSSGNVPQADHTIVLGYMKEFLQRLQLEEGGRLTLGGRTVTAAINDRFCLNVVHHFDQRVDLEKFWTLNRCFVPGADKGVAYELLNDFLRHEPR